MSETVKFKALKGEIIKENNLDGEEKNKVGEVHIFNPKVFETSEYKEHYWVHGSMFDHELCTEFAFEKDFDNQIDAEVYFDAFIKKYPLSSIIIKKYKYSEIKLYEV